MRIALLLFVGALHMVEVNADQPQRTGPCASDTSAVQHRRPEVAGFLGQEDHLADGLPYRPALSSILVVTDSTTCAAGLAAFNRPGDEPVESVLILDLAGSGWAIVGSMLSNDTAHYFTRNWQYLFTIHGI